MKCNCRLNWVRPPRWIPTSHVLVGIAPDVFAEFVAIARRESCEPEVIVREALNAWLGLHK